MIECKEWYHECYRKIPKKYYTNEALDFVCSKLCKLESDKSLSNILPFNLYICFCMFPYKPMCVCISVYFFFVFLCPCLHTLRN